jgi:hypothetical protein
MARIGKFLQLVVGIALAAFAMSATAAPDKLIELLSTVPSAIPAQTVASSDPCADPSLLPLVTLTIKNKSPSGGNANINTVRIFLENAPAGVVLCNPISLAPTGGTAVITDQNGTPLATGNTISISGMSGVKPSKSFTVTVRVYVAPNTLCTSATWNVDAWVGNSFNGDPFNPDPDVGPNADKKTVGIGCDAVLIGCGGGLQETSGGNTTSLTRFPDKDGSACEEVAINLLFSDQNRTVEAQWNQTAHPNLVLKSDTLWPIEDLTGSLWPARTRIAYTVDEFGAPKFFPAPACGDTAPPTTSNFTMPDLPTNDPLIPDELEGTRSRMCIVFEKFDVQPLSSCPASPFGCVRVQTIMWITGDAWLSRQ